MKPAALTCDVCPDPGACCRDFPLYSAGPIRVGAKTNEATLLEAMVWAAQQTYASPDQSRMYLGLPFLPNRYDASRDAIRWRCVNLLPDGRCGDYDHRPYGPCVLYQPQQDAMCVLHSREQSRFVDESWFPKESADV